MLGRVFATQSSVSAEELRCVLLLGNISTDTRLLRTLTCYSSRDDADNGCKDSHRVGLVLLMPCLVHGREGENMSWLRLVAH